MRIMAMNKGSDCIAIWNLFYAGVQAVHEGVKARNFFFICFTIFYFLFCILKKDMTLHLWNLMDI